VKDHGALNLFFIIGQDEKDHLLNTLVDQIRVVPEPKLLIIIRITHQGTPLRAPGFHNDQPFMNKGYSNTLSLIIRQDGDGAESVPAGASV